MSDDKLVMTFEPNTIQHLGIKMYSNMPPALAELIANAYDACSPDVHIKLYDQTEKKVIIEDSGIGMSFKEVNEYFLRIGRNRRDEKQESPCGRTPTGKKGLGKLALFGIGEKIEIETCQGREGVKFFLDWNEILKCKGKNYEPIFEKLPKGKISKGTRITLTNLKRETGFPIEDYAESIAKLFNFKDKFIIYLSLNDGQPIEIDNKLKYKNITPEFEWDISNIIKKLNKEYEYKNEIKGIIFTTEKPLKSHLRGITLFANGRMINSPEFFGPSESSHFYSYATGWLNIDIIDNWNEDVISTNRQSIDWEHPKTIELRKYIASCVSLIEREWREYRKKKKKDRISEKANLNIQDWINKLPENVQSNVEDIVNMLDDTPELSEETQQRTIRILHTIIPEYANLHWRNLEEEIKKVSEKYYQSKDYYTAFIEALKRYIHEVRKKSGVITYDERVLMQTVWGGKKLSVTKKYKKTNGSNFQQKTIDNIECGQHQLSEGIVVGGRHPLQHEEHMELSKTGLFSEKDCLDFLSLLSHLFKRLNDAEKP